MQVKKFEAPTIQEALDTIKRELGPEAIILQTKQNRRGFGLMSKGSVEVTVAVSDRALNRKQVTESKLPPDSRQAIQKLPAEKQAKIYDKYADKHLQKALAETRDQVTIGARAQTSAQVSSSSSKRLTATRYVDIPGEPAAPTTSATAAVSTALPGQVASESKSRHVLGLSNGMSLEEEVRHLKRMIEEMKVTQEIQDSAVSIPEKGKPREGTSAPALQDALRDALEQLIVNGVDKRYALMLVKKVGFELGPERSQNPDLVLDQLAAEIMRSTEVMSPLTEGTRLAALVGPTGVGKTTTVAKIASHAVQKRGMKVGLINVDNFKVGAFDQLATYAKILNLPFRSATSVADLRSALQDFQKLDLVLIDTSGRSQRDLDSLKEMGAILASVPEIRTHLVLSVSTRDSELYDMSNRFSMLRPQSLIMSKLDEATFYGCIYNVSNRAKLPLMYFTTGQRVPEDIEEATRERVVSLLMDI